MKKMRSLSLKKEHEKYLFFMLDICFFLWIRYVNFCDISLCTTNIYLCYKNLHKILVDLILPMKSYPPSKGWNKLIASSIPLHWPTCVYNLYCLDFIFKKSQIIANNNKEAENYCSKTENYMFIILVIWCFIWLHISNTTTEEAHEFLPGLYLVLFLKL